MISGIGSASAYDYSAYNTSFQNPGNALGSTADTTAGIVAGSTAGTAASTATAAGMIGTTTGITTSNGTEPSQSELRALKQTGAVECATCASRKYQDGSDENVSFKSAAHIDPASSGAKVMAHEQEHVSNAYSKAAKDNGEVVSTSVSLKSSICPECGRSYVAGGTTNSMIKYNEGNPYGKNQKSADYAALTGNKLNAAV